MIRVLLFALLFAMPAMADNFSNNQSGVSSCTIDIVGSSSTPITATANYSPITYNCSAGTYLPADAIECATCPVGSYCGGGQYAYNETTDQGINPCATNYTSSAGAAACSPMSYSINYVLNGGSSVPSTYTQVEYITFNFDTYIDTGYKFTSEIAKVKFDFNMTSFAAGGGQMGGQNAPNNTTALIVYDNMLYIGYEGFWNSNILSTGRHNVEISANTGSVTVTTDNQQTFSNTYTGSIQSTNSWPFGTYFSSQHTGHGIAGDLYSLQLYDNNVLVFNGVPARRNSDGVLGMYDTVSETFFTNQGAGTFIAGPDTTTMPTNTYTYGIGATIDYVPTRSNSTFAGWCDNAALTSNCTTPKTIGTTATGDKTFYAKYLCDTGYSTNVSNTACDANTINIQWDDGNGGYTAGTCSYGGSITTPTTAPTKRGHVFTGWTFDLGN